uniref:Odorant receptor n=1 Tax=Dendroctonus ponderosae TaxID=77166 RepID=A0AAR5P774_DENPD
MEKDKFKILSLHINVLIFLQFWPNPLFNNVVNNHIMSIVCFITVTSCIPCIWTIYKVIYIFTNIICYSICIWFRSQVFEGMYDIGILFESFICFVNIMAYLTAYWTIFRNKAVIENLINDICIFLPYCPTNLIRDTDASSIRYTKYLIVYVTLGVFVNLAWPAISPEGCMRQRRLLMQITEQIKHCCDKFEHINFKGDVETARKEFLECVRYHRAILEYAERVFTVFAPVMSAYLVVTSSATALIGYQIVETDNTQDRFRYAMLLLAWGCLFFMICLYAQILQDESVLIADALYNSDWTCNSIYFRHYIIRVIARAHKPLYFNISFLGKISLTRFVSVSNFNKHAVIIMNLL